jgi:putative ABC transport system permease protein
MTMFFNSLKTAWRNIIRHKGYSFINIAGLALGMASCIAIASYLRFELSFDRFHKNGNRVYRLVEKQFFEGQDETNLGQSTPWMGETFLEFPEVSKAVNFINMGTIWVKYQNEMEEIPHALIADPDVFEVFSFKLLRGDPRNALLEPDTAVITEATARRIFKDADPIGQTLQGSDSETYTITAVAENVPENSHIQFDMLVSIMKMRNQPVEWDNYDHYSPTYILLKQNANLITLESKLPAHTKKYFRMNANHVFLSLQRLRDIHLRSKHIMWEINWMKGDIMYIYYFSIIMVFILLVACINFVNLSTARSVSRAREVGVRKVIGANKLQLIRQFIGESLFFFICAFFLAIALVQTIKPVLESILGAHMSFHYLNNWIFVAGILCFLVGAGVLAGIYPAFILSSFRPVVVLKSSFSHAKKSDKLRKALVMVQFAVSIMLIFCTLMVSKQFGFMRNKDTGFDKSQVVVLPMTEQMQEHFDALKEDVSKYPGIQGVTASTRELGTSLWRNQIFFEGKNPEEQWISPYMAVDYDFVSFYGIQLLEGRDFSPDYAEDNSSRSYIINETLAKQIGWENPIGQKFRIGDSDWGTVVGVVKDFNFRSLHHKIEPVALYVYRPWLFQMSVRIGTEDISRTLGYLEEKMQPYRGEQPFLCSFLDEDFSRLYQNEEKSRRLFGIFSLLAIVISCLGLFALASFTAEQKTREIGIRKILGSSVFDIIVMLSWRFTKWAVLANIIALPVAWYVMSRWLQNFAYRVQAGIDTFLLAAGIMLLFSLLTVSFRVFRAASANPIDSIRYE